MLPILFNNRELFVISPLNNNSLILAKSIRDTYKSSIIIFTDCSSADDTFKTTAKNIGCRIYSKSIETLKLETHNPASMIRVVLMNKDEDVNLKSALKLTEKLRGNVNAEIYTFNTSKESEFLLDSIDKGARNGSLSPIKLRRVNMVRNQIYLDILNNSLFEYAVEEYNEKIISVLIVGLGQYGMEMLKAVLWCGQMDGYVVRVNIIDKNPNIESVFYRQCPGILQRGLQPKNGEDYYELNFFGGIDVNTHEFTECVKTIESVSLVFVSLGNENYNIETAIDLRSLISGIQIDNGRKPDHTQSAHQQPRILTVVHSPEKAILMKENRLSNYKKQYYRLDCIGVNSDVYSYENVFLPKLENMALQLHMQWGSPEDFNNYEYNRRSSMASAIHKKYRDMLMPDDETKDILEHKRWNAYMRSTEGYSFGYIRDDLAQRHPLLVKYDNLSRVEKDKDTKMNTVFTQPIF